MGAWHRLLGEPEGFASFTVTQSLGPGWMDLQLHGLACAQQTWSKSSLCHETFGRLF